MPHAMIFGKTWERVVAGQKTITTRPIRKHDRSVAAPSETMFGYDPTPPIVQVWDANPKRRTPYNHGSRIRFEVGKPVTFKPARTAPGIGKIVIRSINAADVRMGGRHRPYYTGEGFGSWRDFMLVWTQMHDPDAYPIVQETLAHQALQNWLMERPANRYVGWKLRFEVVDLYQDRIDEWRGDTIQVAPRQRSMFGE